MGDIAELDGVAWCLTHDSLWTEGDTECNDRHHSVLSDCIEAPLYVGPAIDAYPQATDDSRRTQ